MIRVVGNRASPGTSTMRTLPADDAGVPPWVIRQNPGNVERGRA